MADTQNPKAMEPYERLIAAAWLGTKDPETRKRLGEECLKVLTFENLAVLALILGVYALGSAVTAPWSLIINAALATVGAIAMGATVLKTAPSLVNYARVAWYAQTEADLQLAAKHFSNGLVAVGPDLLIMVLGATSFGLVRRVLLAKIKLPRFSEPKAPPKASEPVAPKGEPTVPKGEPTVPKGETAAPKGEPAAPKGTPRPPGGKPSLATRVGGVALDVAAGNAAGQLAVGLKPWHILLPLGVAAAGVTIVLVARSGAGRAGRA